MNPSFWQGKRVLLTGHTGFKGSWLSIWLQSMGTELTGFSLLPPTDPNLFEIGEVSKNMNSVIGDIRDLNKLQHVFNECRPEIVIHMAAQPIVRHSYQNPVDTFSTNVMGTVHLLEAVRKNPYVKAVVNITTDKCYENKEWIWGYRENETLGGLDPYSNSKACAELVSSSYRDSFFNLNNLTGHGVALATARAGNVIGGGDWAQDRLIPDILSALEQNQKVNIRNPQSIRPWQHVMEPLCGYLTLAEHLFEDGFRFAEAWNFGPNDEDSKTVRWVVELLASLYDGQLEWQHDSEQNPHEANYLKLDISKARSRLNWKPRMNLLEALGLVVDWSKKFKAGSNMREITLAQINAYQAKAQ